MTTSRRALKWGNYRAAQRILGTEPLRNEQLLLVTSLLTEELTSRLRAGETTEALESAKIDEKNPVLGLFQSILSAMVPGAKSGTRT